MRTRYNDIKLIVIIIYILHIIVKHKYFIAFSTYLTIRAKQKRESKENALFFCYPFRDSFLFVIVIYKILVLKSNSYILTAQIWPVALRPKYDP